jgi:hypothetical protein
MTIFVLISDCGVGISFHLAQRVYASGEGMTLSAGAVRVPHCSQADIPVQGWMHVM